MSLLDPWVVLCLRPLAVWILLNGLDDLALDAVCLVQRLHARLTGGGRMIPPTDAELDAAPPKRIAVYVPLWREDRVIQKMLEHNLAANRYEHLDFFVGVYPNDGPTRAAVREVQATHRNVHLALCPHDGPTSKADCLNWIYQRMLQFEAQYGVRFAVIATHDAEDLIHPDAFRWINYYAGPYDMVQVPVLALPTPLHELTHGVYCDEFAEFQFRDLPARQRLGGFLPSSGVGTGFARAAIEKLAEAHANRVFDPSCLTEDYENGWRLHRLGGSQLFTGIHKCRGTLVATREYFPRTFRGAVRQRTRWILGIAFQTWERHGWRSPARQLYWLWRDRKGLAGHLVPLFSNVLCAYGAATWLGSALAGVPWGLARAMDGRLAAALYATLALQLFRVFFRACVSGAVYGWRFALGVPLRMVWANYINACSTLCAYQRYFSAKLRGCPLVWIKTDHAYPSRNALMQHKRRLGEVLVTSYYISPSELEAALASRPEGMRLGEHLTRSGVLSESELYDALSLQQNVPLGKPAPAAVARAATRALPAEVARRWKVLPFRIAAGRMLVASPELPSDQLQEELRRFSALEAQFQLVTPAEFEELAEEYLPPEPGPMS